MIYISFFRDRMGISFLSKNNLYFYELDLFHSVGKSFQSGLNLLLIPTNVAFSWSFLTLLSGKASLTNKMKSFHKTRPSKQYKILCLWGRKKRKGKGGKYLEKQNIWSAEKRRTLLILKKIDRVVSWQWSYQEQNLPSLICKT